MKTIVCIDDKFGVSFDGKRQSRDRGLIDDIMDFTRGSRIIISPQSAELFEGKSVEIADYPPLIARENDFIFSEDGKLLSHLDKTKEIVIYKWNRTYPRDLLLDIVPDECGFKLCESVEFVGTSHKKITREVYKK